MIKKYIKLFIEVSLNYTEDFIDLFDNHWVYMWSMVSFHFLEMSAIFQSFNKGYLARMKDNEIFNIILDLIRLSLPSEFIIQLNIPEINNIAIILIFLMTNYPFINIVLGIIINKNIQISQYMIRYFSIFRWILFIPITKFLTGFLRQSSADSFGYYLCILSLPMILLQCLFIEYIFRNHQFRDSNLARKNPSAYTFIYVIMVFINIFSNEFEILGQGWSVILCHLSMIILFSEYFDCFPISNSQLNQYYFRLMCIVEADAILLTFFLNSSWNSENIYFFQYIQLKFIVWHLSGHIQNLWFMKYIIVAQDLTEKRFLKFNHEQIRKEHNLIKTFLIKRKTSYFDIYAEYISQLQQESVGNQNSKMKLIFIVINHRINCINLSCYCHHHSFYIFKHEYLSNKISSTYKQVQPLTKIQKNRSKVKEVQQDLLDDQMVSQQKINKFINVLFRETLKLQRSKPSDFKKEILILKHSSFITRQLDNPPQAYYDLKILSNQNVNSSLHFQVLNGIVSLALQNQIIKKQRIYLATQALEEGNININHDASSQKQISLESILENIKYQEMISQGIKVIVNLKIQFWNNYLNAETDKFQQVQDYLVIEIIKLQEIMAQYTQNLKKNNSYSIISIRVTQLYHMMITRNMKEISRNEHEFLEMIRKDSCMPEELLTFLKLLENEVEILIASILNDKGHILNKKTPRMAAFFNYDFASFKDIFNVKQLMPQFLAQIHDGLMDNYLHRGYSKIIKASDRDVFIMDANRFIKPVKLNLENFFAFKDDFNLIAALMQFKQNKQYIIFDITGKVQGASQQLFQSIKEKSDFIHKKNGNIKNIHKLRSLTREVFFDELFIFMLIPDIIQQVKNFLKEQIIMMKAANYTDFGETSIMKYFIETGQKNIEISRFKKCELYVPENLQLIIQQYKELENKYNQCGFKMDTRFTQTINASQNISKMIEKQQRKDKEKDDNNQFIKGFSMFNLEEIKFIDDHMSQHRIVYIFQGACFRYYIRINLNFTLLAQTKYTSRNMAFFVLNVVEKKVPKNVLSHIIMDRMIKKNPSQFKRQEKLQNTLITATQGVNDQQCQQKLGNINPELLKNQASQSLLLKKNANWLQRMLGKDSNLIEVQQPKFSQKSQQFLKEQEIKKSQEIQKTQQQFNYQNLRRDALAFTTDDQQLMKVKIQDGLTELFSQNNIPTTLSIAVSDNEEQKKSENNIASSTEIISKKAMFWCGLAAKIKEKRRLEKISHKEKHSHKFNEGDNLSYIQHQYDSNSDNQFDEDVTEKSSQIYDNKQEGKLFQFKGNEKLIKDEEGDSVSSNRQDYLIVGSVLVRQIFQSKSLSKGENKFIKLNIALTAIYVAFYLGLIYVLTSYQNQQLELYRKLSFNLDLEMDYDKIIGSSSLQTIIPFIQNSERRLFWAEATNQYFIDGSESLKKHIYQNQNYLVYLNNIGQKDIIALKLLDNVKKGISTQEIEFMTLLQIISTATEQINSDDQNIRLSSLFLVYENYAELKNLFDKNDNFALSSFDNLHKSFYLSFISLYIVLIVIILQILLLSLWANNQQNKYLKFLLLSITRIKIQEIEVEVNRLQSFNRVLTDNQKLWISYDIYQLFFFPEVPDHENKDIRKRDRTNIINQKYEQKHRNKYDMLIFFFLASSLLIGFSVYGIFLMNSFIINQNVNLNTQCDQQKLEINLSNFIHKITKQMAQSSINLDDHLRLTYNQSIQIQQEINQYRIIIRQTKNDIQFQTLNNKIFQLYMENLCEKIQINQELHKSIQTLCQNNLDQGHLSLGINNIITGILGVDCQNNLQFMVENCEVELFIWNYYKVYSPYIQYIIKENYKIIAEQNLEEFDKLIIVKLLGLLLAILIAIIASICVKYFIRQRKGSQLLLSLIPHEKLSLGNTLNLLKQIQQL